MGCLWTIVNVWTIVICSVGGVSHLDGLFSLLSDSYEGDQTHIFIEKLVNWRRGDTIRPNVHRLEYHYLDLENMVTFK